MEVLGSKKVTGMCVKQKTRLCRFISTLLPKRGKNSADSETLPFSVESECFLFSLFCFFG